MRFSPAIAFSFAFIFFFSSVDNSIAPMTSEISARFSVSPETGLLFVSACSWAVAAGLIAGPWLVSILSPRKSLILSALAMSFSSFLFSISHNFSAGLLLRIISGLGGGLAACVMWWLAYHGVDKKDSPPMLAVLMSARPLAVAIGVPAAAVSAFYFDWKYPLIFTAAGTFISAIGIYRNFPAGDGILPAGKPVSGYIEALKTPYAILFYSGFFINRMCYFGFYAFCGIWFKTHYGFDLRKTGYYLLVIGLAEAAVNFFSASMVSRMGYKKTFNLGMILSILCLPLFIFGSLPPVTALMLISAFMLADRVYAMALVYRIPAMFASGRDKTSFGSLNTLSAWGAAGLISAIFSGLIKKGGILYAELLILACFIAGSYMLFLSLKKTENL